MKFFADECCDTEMVASLRIEGHDVLYVLEEEPGLKEKKSVYICLSKRSVDPAVGAS